MIITDNILELQRRIATYDDEPAYKEVFLRYYTPLVDFALSYIPYRSLAEEVVSDVFIKIWEKRNTITHIQNLRVYLYISTKNTALNYLDRQKRTEFLSLDELKQEERSPFLNPEQIMISGEMMKRIQQAIQSLPPRCKLVFKLVREDGLPYREVAEILDISVKTIDNQLAIALRKISESINFSLKPRELKF
ncbi:MAG TPA: RNA polymerase sigma-70 factor [Flavitalea sp.]|nr:RNA polymerase sigma-70 factor [Flavitalea sp.]